MPNRFWHSETRFFIPDRHQSNEKIFLDAHMPVCHADGSTRPDSQSVRRANRPYDANRPGSLSSSLRREIRHLSGWRELVQMVPDVCRLHSERRRDSTGHQRQLHLYPRELRSSQVIAQTDGTPGQCWALRIPGAGRAETRRHSASHPRQFPTGRRQRIQPEESAVVL